MRLILPLLVCSMVVDSAAFAAEDDGYTDGKAGWGGFVIPVPLAVQAKLDLTPGEGAMVVHVRPGGTADKLGLGRGDVVLELNDRLIANRRDIRGVMSTVAPGDQAAVLARRHDGTTTTLNGTFQERKPRPPGRGPWGGPGGPGGWGGPPPEPQDPDVVAANQYAELLSEQRQLAESASELLALNEAVADLQAMSAGNWYLRETLRTTP